MAMTPREFTLRPPRPDGAPQSSRDEHVVRHRSSGSSRSNPQTGTHAHPKWANRPAAIPSRDLRTRDRNTTPDRPFASEETHCTGNRCRPPEGSRRRRVPRRQPLAIPCQVVRFARARRKKTLGRRSSEGLGFVAFEHRDQPCGADLTGGAGGAGGAGGGTGACFDGGGGAGAGMTLLGA